MRFFLRILVSVVLASPAFGEVVSQDIQRNLKPQSASAFTGGNEARFNELIEAVVVALQETANAYDGTLVKEANWSSNNVNATATVDGDTWKIIAWGGLYRLKGMTDDSYQMAICHEAGHLFGGFPFYNGAIRATSEGQADYFAAHVCSAKIWQHDAMQNQAAYDHAPDAVKEACQASQRDPALCTRIALAGEHLLAVLTAGARLALTTPDAAVAAETFFSAYPGAQCRIDTYFRGALCAAEWDLNHIPGFALLPRNGLAAEREAMNVSCHRGRRPEGARPACWYFQRVD